MGNEVIVDKRVEKEVVEATEDMESSVENRKPPVGPIMMQMETNVSLVEDIFTQNSESQEEEAEETEIDNLDKMDGEENDNTDQSKKQIFGRRLLSISEVDMVEEEVENNEEDSSETVKEQTLEK